MTSFGQTVRPNAINATDHESLFAYRFGEAEETLADARKIPDAGLSKRSVVNNAYYAIFYSVSALLIHENIEHGASKHPGIISIFDRSITLYTRN